MYVILTLHIDPIKLIGEGEYNLNVLTVIKVTDSYMGIDQKIRKCQNDEPFFNCTSRKYVNSYLQECGCLPMNMWHDNEVY